VRGGTPLLWSPRPGRRKRPPYHRSRSRTSSAHQACRNVIRIWIKATIIPRGLHFRAGWPRIASGMACLISPRRRAVFSAVLKISAALPAISHRDFCSASSLNICSLSIWQAHHIPPRHQPRNVVGLFIRPGSHFGQLDPGRWRAGFVVGGLSPSGPAQDHRARSAPHSDLVLADSKSIIRGQSDGPTRRRSGRASFTRFAKHPHQRSRSVPRAIYAQIHIGPRGFTSLHPKDSFRGLECRGCPR